MSDSDSDGASVDLEEQLELAAYEEMMAERNALSSSSAAAAGPTQPPAKRVTINNKSALERHGRDLNLDSIAGFPLAFSDVLAVTGTTATATQDAESGAPSGVTTVDAEDDLKRELSFYQQALHAVIVARKQLVSEGIPFERPADYFAEMVKSDHQMMRIRQRLVDESLSIKKSEEAKKQRELRKFGKSIQEQKLRERQKMKADTLDKIQSLKRKRKNGSNAGAADDVDGQDPFEIALESGGAGQSDKKRGSKPAHGSSSTKRSTKDAKYGFGGKKRHQKSNTRASTDDFDFSSQKNKQLPKGFRGASRPQPKSKSSAAPQKKRARR